MGWSIYLKDGDGNICEVEPFNEGSNIIGDDYQFKAEICVTYNYREFFRFSWLSGKSAKETIPVLKERINDFADEQPSDNYWKCTKGNVKKILKVLLSWAEMYPDAIWTVH